MAEIARLNVEAAREHPERHFASPDALVDEVLLTRGQKIAALEKWRARLLGAGPSADASTGSGDAAHVLRGIDAALAALRQNSA